MKNSLKITGALLLAAGVLAGCNTGNSQNGIQSPTTPPVAVLRAGEDGKKITINYGELFKVTLAGNPTTGYIWEPETREAGVVMEYGETKYEADSDAAGAPGKITLTFIGADRGEYDLKLVYRRPFEKDKPPAKTFSAHVTVK